MDRTFTITTSSTYKMKLNGSVAELLKLCLDIYLGILLLIKSTSDHHVCYWFRLNGIHNLENFRISFELFELLGCEHNRRGKCQQMIPVAPRAAFNLYSTKTGWEHELTRWFGKCSAINETRINSSRGGAGEEFGCTLDRTYVRRILFSNIFHCNNLRNFEIMTEHRQSKRCSRGEAAVSLSFQVVRSTEKVLHSQSESEPQNCLYLCAITLQLDCSVKFSSNQHFRRRRESENLHFGKSSRKFDSIIIIFIWLSPVKLSPLSSSFDIIPER